MGYELLIRGAHQGTVHDRTLHLSVWEMSMIRDRMLSSGAAFCTEPPIEPAALALPYSGAEPGIPAYKLSMIDDVVVHVTEIRQALALMALFSCDEEDATNPLWKRWLDFLERAAEADGFSVA